MKTLIIISILFITGIIFAQVGGPNQTPWNGYPGYGIQPQNLVIGLTMDSGTFTTDPNPAPKASFALTSIVAGSINSSHSIGQASLSFNGTSTFMYIPDAQLSSIDSSQNWVVNVWCYWSGGVCSILSRDGAFNGTGCGNNSSWTVNITAVGLVGIRFVSNDGVNGFANSTNWAIASNSWTMITAKMAGNITGSLFINGILTTNVVNNSGWFNAGLAGTDLMLWMWQWELFKWPT